MKKKPAMAVATIEDDGPFSSLDSYMRTFAPQMAARVHKSLQPLYDPATDPISPDVAALADIQTFPAPYPAQAVTVQGLLHALAQTNVGWMVGEMGVGKTPIGLWVLKILLAKSGRPGRGIVSCPNQLVKKWANHAHRILGASTRVIIVKKWSNLCELKELSGEPKCDEVWIIPRDRGKLSYSYRSALLGRVGFDAAEQEKPHYPPRGGWASNAGRAQIRGTIKCKSGRGYYKKLSLCCPKCGRVIGKPEGTKSDHPTDWFQDAKGKPTARRKCNAVVLDLLGAPKRDRRGRIQLCGEALWQAHSGERWVDNRPAGQATGNQGAVGPRIGVPGVSPRRMSPSEYLHRFCAPMFKLYIADEVHELKGEGTLQGQMFAALAGVSENVLNMTGTLVGGYADNMLHLLWRVMAGRMRQDGMRHSEEGFKDFVKKYGVLQTQKRYVLEGNDFADRMMGRGRNKASTREKFLPGISPVLFTTHLMHNSVFLRLMQMHDHLPNFHEKIHLVPMTDDQSSCMARMYSEFDVHRNDQKRQGLPVRAWSGARAAFLRWTDRPWTVRHVMDRDRFLNPILAFTTPALTEAAEYPKERRLRRLIQIARAKGRKVWVFTEMTGPEWDVTPRLVDYLAKYGIRAQVLRTSKDGGPDPMEREEWIEKTSKTCDVIISNPNLVKTGLDLYDFPTIVFYYCGDNTFTLRQAARRAWRLGQLNDCEVHYLSYSKPRGHSKVQCKPSIQSVSLGLMSKKLSASLALEGDFSSEGLAAMTDSTDIQSQLARVIAGELQVEDPRESFRKYREQLMKSLPNLGKGLGKQPAPMENHEPIAIEIPTFEHPAPSDPDAWKGVPVYESPACQPFAPKLPEPKPEPKVEAVGPEPVLAPIVARTLQEAVEGVLGRKCTTSVRNLFFFKPLWVQVIRGAPTSLSESDLGLIREITLTDPANGALAFVMGSGESREGVGRDVVIGGKSARIIIIPLPSWLTGCRTGQRMET